MQDWHDFFVATAGASAALVGFIFVGVSINLRQILSYPQLPSRALKALILPVNVLLVSCCGLVPNQYCRWLGSELIVLWLLTAGISLALNRTLFGLTAAPYRRYYRINLWLTQLAIVPYGLAGGWLSV